MNCGDEGEYESGDVGEYTGEAGEMLEFPLKAGELGLY